MFSSIQIWRHKKVANMDVKSKLIEEKVNLNSVYHR